MMDVSDKYAVVTEIFDNIAMLDTARIELGDNSGGQGERQRHSLVSLTSLPPCGDQERSSVMSAPSHMGAHSDMVTPHHMVSHMGAHMVSDMGAHMVSVTTHRVTLVHPQLVSVTSLR